MREVRSKNAVGVWEGEAAGRELRYYKAPQAGLVTDYVQDRKEKN